MLVIAARFQIAFAAVTFCCMRIVLGMMFVVGCGGQGASSPNQLESPTRDEPAIAVENDGVAPKATRCPQAKLSPTPSKEFAHAETFYKQSFLTFEITRTPKTKAEGDRVLGTLVRLGDEALANYVVVLNALPAEQESEGKLAYTDTAYWSIAALVRTGEVHSRQADVLVAIPVPQSIASGSGSNPDMLSKYNDALNDLVAPFREQAKRQWELAVSQGKELCIESEWTRLAEEHLRHL